MVFGGIASMIMLDFNVVVAVLFGFLPSGIMFIAFTWTAKDARWPPFPVRLILAVLPAVLMTALVAYAAAVAPPPPPPPPTVAEMLDDPTLVDCKLLKPAYEEARWATGYGIAPGMSKDEIMYHVSIVSLFHKNCF